MAQVFISYADNDRGAAQPIIEAFSQAGLNVNVWHPDLISPWEERRELKKSRCVVVLWSIAAAQSQFVRREIRHAVQAWSSNRLVLAALDDTPLPVGLRDLSTTLISCASNSGTKLLIERAQAIVGRKMVLYEHSGASVLRHRAASVLRRFSSLPLSGRIVAVVLFTAILIVGIITHPPELVTSPEPDRTAMENADPIAKENADRIAKENAGRGRAYYAKHDYDRAIADYNEAIRLDPESAISYSNRGRAYISKHDYDHAIADYNEARIAKENADRIAKEKAFPPVNLPAPTVPLLPLMLIVLVLGAAMGAAVAWAWTVRSRRRLARYAETEEERIMRRAKEEAFWKRLEAEVLRDLVIPHEELTPWQRARWRGGFRWFESPKIVCLEQERAKRAARR